MNQRHSTEAAQRPLAIGIDVGGTHIRVSIVENLCVLDGLRQSPTSAFSSASQFFDWLSDSINQLCDLHKCRSRVTSIGMGLPGVLDEPKERLLRSINVPYLEGVALSDDLSRKTNLPVTLMTDAEAATWGAYANLSPKPDRFVHLRFGTGIACGCIRDSKIKPLIRIGQEHLRMLVVDETASAKPCACGLRGCLETIASGKALLHVIQAHGLTLNVAALQEGYVRGDAWCQKLCAEVASSIICAISSVCRELQPDEISIGGGVAKHWPAMIDVVLRDAEKTFTDNKLPMPRIMKTPADDESGVIGAAYLSLQA